MGLDYRYELYICGLLDLDEERRVFWWRGEETWAVLENAWNLVVEKQMRRSGGVRRAQEA